MELPPHPLAFDLQQAASELGFPLFGITSAKESPGFARFCHWLDQGYAGSMDYLVKRRAAYEHPSSVLAEVKTLVMLGMPYWPATSRRRKRRSEEGRLKEEAEQGKGQVAAYASGTRDYHDVIHERLRKLSDWLTQQLPEANVRGVVDTAPLLEREFAVLAGLGWIGKNTLLLNRAAGSYFFLAALLTDASIESQGGVETDHCGTCTACMDACPTKAFPQPRVLDATRCISYLTIEHRGAISKEFREPIGNWVFGCDVCQQVCPWNRMAKSSDEPAFQPHPERYAIDLLKLLALDDDSFRQQYRKTPLWRTRRVGMQRNAMIVLGNQRRTEALPLLIRHLSSEHVVLRQTAAWAIGRIRAPDSRSCLEARLTVEESPAVRNEIDEALEFLA
jgi:epoxyqueuosine reductase